MMNWPEILRDMEHWADGFLTGAAAASLIAIAGTAIVLLARAIQTRWSATQAIAGLLSDYGCDELWGMGQAAYMPR